MTASRVRVVRLIVNRGDLHDTALAGEVGGRVVTDYRSTDVADDPVRLPGAWVRTPCTSSLAMSTDGFTLTAARARPTTLVKEIWGSRQLIGVLARKDFFVRYRRAYLGVLWALAVPLVQAAVFAIVFSGVIGDRVDTQSYAAFLVVGTVGWSVFAGIIISCSTSIVDNAALASKIYFPRAVPVIAGTLTSFYASMLGVGVAVVMLPLFGASLGVRNVLVIPALLLAVLLGGGFALVLSALHVYFRDIRYLATAAIQPWFYATPVLYPIDLVPDAVRPVIVANPATGVVELFRAGSVGADPGWPGMVMVTCAWVVGLAIVAVYLHCRFNRVFCDLL